VTRAAATGVTVSLLLVSGVALSQFAGSFGGGSAAAPPTVLASTFPVDFASMNTQATDTQTIPLLGARVTDSVHCGPVSGGSMQGTDMHPVVADAGYVDIVAHNDTGGTINPSPMDIRCTVVRP
jgi:hypothetical protein